jgi:hypothetical protein
LGNLALVGMLIFGFVIALIRTSPHSAGVLWAEDATVFFMGTVGGPDAAIANIVHPYVGYVHVVPRLLALILSFLPISVIAYAYTVAGAAVVSALALFVFVAARRHFSSTLIPYLAWFQIFTLSIAIGEAANNLAYLHFYLDVAAFWAVFTRFSSPGLRILATVIVGGAILSDPVAFLLLVPVVIRAITFGFRAERVLFLTAIIASAIQACFPLFISRLVGDGRYVGPDHPSIGNLLDGFSIKIVLVGLFGVKITSLPGPNALLIASGAAALVALAAILLIVKFLPRRAPFVLSAVGFAVIVYAASWYVNWSGDVLGVTYGGRYAIVPILTFAILWFSLLDAILTRIRRPGLFFVAALAVAGSIAPPIIDGRLWDFRAGVESFPEAVLDAADNCEGKTPETVSTIESGAYPITTTCAVTLEIAGGD